MKKLIEVNKLLKEDLVKMAEMTKKITCPDIGENKKLIEVEL